MAKSVGLVLALLAPLSSSSTILETFTVSEAGEYETEFCTPEDINPLSGVCSSKDHCYDFIAGNVTHQLLVWFNTKRFDISSEDPNRYSIDHSTVYFGPQPSDYDQIPWSGSGSGDAPEQPDPLNDPYCNGGTRVVVWRWDSLNGNSTFEGIYCNNYLGLSTFEGERIRLCVDIKQDQGGWGEFHGNHGTLAMEWDVIPPPEPAKDVTYDVELVLPVATEPFSPPELENVEPIEFVFDGPEELILTCENMLAVYQLSVIEAGGVVDVEGVTCTALTTTRTVFETMDDHYESIKEKCGPRGDFYLKTDFQKLHCRSKISLKNKSKDRSADMFASVELVWTVANVPETSEQVSDTTASPVYEAITTSDEIEITEITPPEPPVAIEPIDECEAFDCNGNGQCFDMAIGYYCTCHPGYSGDDCENSVCDSFTECEHLCYVNVEGLPTCACGEGKTSVGNVCADPDEGCLNHGCSDFCGYDSDDLPACFCPENKYLDDDGKTCVEVSDICATNVCQKGCENTTPSLPAPLVDQSYTCSCGNNEVLNENGSCSNDACHDNPCQDLCILDESATDGFKCQCTSGRSLNEDGQTCTSDVCLTIYCSHDCVVHPETGAESCVCPGGYTLDPEDNTNCISTTDLCDGFGCSDGCAVIESQPTCLCDASQGRIGPGEDGKTCTSNPCHNNGPCQHICTVAGGEAVCSCSDGYVGSENCYPIPDACEEKGCSQACYKVNGVAHCACKKGMKLDADELTCINKSSSVSATVVRKDTTIRPYANDFCVHKRYNGFQVDGLVAMNQNCKDDKKNYWRYVSDTKQIKSIGAETKGKDLCLSTKDTSTNTLRLVTLQECDELDDTQRFVFEAGEIRLEVNAALCLWWDSSKDLEFIKTKGCNWKQNFMY